MTYRVTFKHKLGFARLEVLVEAATTVTAVSAARIGLIRTCASPKEWDYEAATAQEEILTT